MTSGSIPCLSLRFVRAYIGRHMACTGDGDLGAAFGQRSGTATPMPREAPSTGAILP